MASLLAGMVVGKAVGMVDSLGYIRLTSCETSCNLISIQMTSIFQLQKMAVRDLDDVCTLVLLSHCFRIFFVQFLRSLMTDGEFLMIDETFLTIKI